MEKKQTAVEWLIEQIVDGKIDLGTYAVFLKKYVNRLEVFEQAKQMEREQHMNTWDESIPFSSFDKYFTKTYGDEKE